MSPRTAQAKPTPHPGTALSPGLSVLLRVSSPLTVRTGTQPGQLKSHAPSPSPGLSGGSCQPCAYTHGNGGPPKLGGGSHHPAGWKKWASGLPPEAGAPEFRVPAVSSGPSPRSLHSSGPGPRLVCSVLSTLDGPEVGGPAKWLKPHPPHPTPGWDLSGVAGGGRCSPHPPLTGRLTSRPTSGLGSGLPGIPGRRFRHRWPVLGSCKCRARRPALVGGWPDTRQPAAGRPTRWL